MRKFGTKPTMVEFVLIVGPKGKTRPTSKTKLTAKRVDAVIAIRNSPTTVHKGGLYGSKREKMRRDEAGQAEEHRKQQQQRQKQKSDAIGGTLGALAGIGIIIAGAVYCCCRKRQ
jgi:hypothetical protein